MPVKGTVASQKNLYKLHLHPSPFRDLSPMTKGSEQLGSTTPTLKPSLSQRCYIANLWEIDLQLVLNVLNYTLAKNRDH